jgi:hypothetical protein
LPYSIQLYWMLQAALSTPTKELQATRVAATV